ncbi:ABC transporter substrate-binding protein [Roseococcus sp. SDR]|uniref:extracellular solute-binding protein n=1 Tax=Roseococcus sp. SDR TaxID=2835532 RepID=UPI001BCDF156|nr:extracellular solute-binding protein [Roseococcus sp. SDR]MBS7788921.1 ABC transporter substrate-binding protein [Roseococcus sp. SDR]MBV1844235.1 ABC transporter substrate-binding protein [Roseococcus sp. SDR]
MIASRRTILAASALSLPLSAPWVTSRAQSGGTLTVVLNQGLLARLWIDELHPVFERETGARINVQQSVTANMLAMLRTQRDNPPDLMQFSEAGVFAAAQAGLLRPHNPANIPNWASLRDAFKLADNYSAGVIDAVHTLYYNTRAQTTQPTAWAQLWDPSSRRRVAIPPITWNSGVRMVTTAAQIATGKPFAEAQRDLDAGIRHLARLKENGAIAYTGAPQAIQMLQSGQIPLVPFYGIFINPIIEQGAPIKPAVPLTEGIHGEIVGLNMPVNARNVELAERYVNMSLSREFQSKIDTVLHSRAANKDVNPSPRTLELLGPPDNILYADWRFLSEQRSRLTDAWNNVFG